MPVYRRVLAHAATDPARPAIVHDGAVLTFGDLGATVRARARALAERFGLRPGDRVALLADPHPEFLLTYLAVHALGAACVPLDARAPAARLDGILRHVSPAATFSSGGIAAGAARQARYSDLASATGGTAHTEVPAEAVADILLTTGTTAEAKAVVLSHRALASAVEHINAVVGTRPGDVEVLALPLHHSFGLGRVRCVLACGATLVLTPGRIDGARLIEALVAHRATGFASVPAGISILLAGNGRQLGRVAGQLRYLELGSSSMPVEQKRALMRLLPETRIAMHYGLTEASRSAFLRFHENPDRLESIGRPSPGVQMRIAGGEGGAGEIEIRGDHLMSGYWQAPELTARVLDGGWLRTGDLGRTDADGWFYLEARKDDVINVGGRKVLPGEIEEVLLGHPAIRECACVGVPDPQGLAGEIVSVWMVPRRPDRARPAFSELAKLLRTRLEPYKVPRRFHWTDALPRSASGKVLRHRLREDA